MNKLFVDTSGWASLFIPTEKYHSQAASVFSHTQISGDRLITSNYVMAELIALIGSRWRGSRTQLFRYIDSIKQAPYVEICHIHVEIDNEAWRFCKARPDKAWSLVDCSSFILMKQLNIQNALTTDHHFQQAGFIQLLK